MAYVVSLKQSAEKELENLPKKIYQKVITRLLLLEKNPRPRGVKKIHGREGYRIRVGDYRILYVVDDTKKEVVVFSIAHRRDVYRW